VTDRSHVKRGRLRALTHRPEEQRYVALLDGELAGMHTEVDPRFEGRGVGSALAPGGQPVSRAQPIEIRIVKTSVAMPM
jgi:hypothetical protein